MKKMLVTLAVICGLVGIVNAAEVAGNDITITADVTYVTKYIWRGYNLFGADSALQPSVDVDFGNGFSANVWMSYANGGDNVAATEYDYTLAYAFSVAEDSAMKTDLSVGYRYYDYPKINSSGKITATTVAGDMQEIFVETAMPELVGGGVTPRIAWYYMWEGIRDSVFGGGISGSIFDLGLDYAFTLESAPELPMTFSWDIVYNDGVLGGDHDWSHMVWGLATSMDCPFGTGGTITPGVYFQNSWEDTVNTSDELWASLSYSLTF